MCSPVRCRTCGKTTWAGCGSHIAAVKAMVPADQWCEGHKKEKSANGSGFFARLLGR